MKGNKSSATARYSNDRGTIKQRTNLIFATSWWREARCGLKQR